MTSVLFFLMLFKCNMNLALLDAGLHDRQQHMKCRCDTSAIRGKSAAILPITGISKLASPAASHATGRGFSEQNIAF